MERDQICECLAKKMVWLQLTAFADALSNIDVVCCTEAVDHFLSTSLAFLSKCPKLPTSIGSSFASAPRPLRLATSWQ